MLTSGEERFGLILTLLLAWPVILVANTVAASALGLMVERVVQASESRMTAFLLTLAVLTQGILLLSLLIPGRHVMVAASLVGLRPDQLPWPIHAAVFVVPTWLNWRLVLLFLGLPQIAAIACSSFSGRRELAVAILSSLASATLILVVWVAILWRGLSQLSPGG